MLFTTITVAIFILFLIENAFFLRLLAGKYERRKKALSDKYTFLKKEKEDIKKKINTLENSLSERFLFYDLTRRIAPLLDKKVLFQEFCEGIKYLGQIENLDFCDALKSPEHLTFELDKKTQQFLSVKSGCKEVIEYMPYFAKLLSLCLERIKLYDKLQKLSIHDSLTKTYNRRYFMNRYLEEFKRAQKFSFNLSFLMFDVDHFKKINDTYGHLVGDAVLREVASIIRENIREVDFMARFGGEEFSAVLSETDKAGAIMMAERISSRVSKEKIKVFDETVAATISIGVGSFPQNTLHPDVLLEVSDKALYKAKLSGRNRVCWF